MTSKRAPYGKRTKIVGKYMLRVPCKHENADHLFEGDKFEPWSRDVDSTAKCEQFRCLDCEAWLSLGPSNDRPRAVRTEMKAAEIAARIDDQPRVLHFEGENAAYAGWIIHAFDSHKPCEQPGEWAGWLAREIKTHEEP